MPDERKRKLRGGSENESAGSRPARRRYTFAPRDTLSKPQQHKPEEVLRPTDTNVLANEDRIEEPEVLLLSSSQVEERVVWEPGSSKRRRNERYHEIAEHRSSSLPSSPLADRTASELILPTTALDPALSSMVKKYNSSVDLLASPGISRSKSDITPFTKRGSSTKAQPQGTPLSLQLYRSLGAGKTPYNVKYQDTSERTTTPTAKAVSKSEMLLDDLEELLDGDSFEQSSPSKKVSPIKKSWLESEVPDFSDDLDLEELDQILSGSRAKSTEPTEFADTNEVDPLDDGFDDEVEAILTQLHVKTPEPPSQTAAKSALRREAFARFQITRVKRNTYEEKGRQKEQVVLSVVDPELMRRTVLVRGMWAELEFEEDDVIHVIGENPAIVDNDTNILVWNPDELLSATTISETLRCERKSVIKSRISFPGEANIPIIVGHTVHSIFQHCLTTGDTSDDGIEVVAEQLLDQFETSILSAGKTKDDVRELLKLHTPFVKEWVDAHVNSTKLAPFQVSKVMDVEEVIWSPEYGIKGYIDVVLKARLSSGKDSVIPMEIKTGKDHISHRAQVSLYELLIKDRYDEDPEFSLLVFTKDQQSVTSVRNWMELKQLINIRNRLSKYHKANTRALPPLSKSRTCEYCDVKDVCMVINKLVENGTDEASGLPTGEFDKITEHLDRPDYAAFFNKWDDLLSKEESLYTTMKKDLWLYSSAEREGNGGNCIGSLTIAPRYDVSESAYFYRFERPQSNLLASSFSRADMVLLSGEDNSFALANAFVDSISMDHVVLRMNKPLATREAETIGQTQSTQMKTYAVPGELRSRKYRIDKDVLAQGFTMARFNITNLFLPDGDYRRRQVVVEGVPPKFTKKPIPYDEGLKTKFNEDQVRAMDKVLSAKDYALVLGMPGTGKTTVIAQLIRSLAQSGKSVLLASYTHSAVDNILMKLLDDDINILRVGNQHKFHPSVMKFAMNSSGICQPKEYREALLKTQVVAVTCLGLNDLVFSHINEFDYCIIDEASQVSLPVCLGPLRYCDKFVLFGDHHQLQPLVMSPEAKKGGLEESLFRMLNDRHPESVVELTYQYRMCSDIMLICNTLIYDGLLKCGNEQVANQRFRIPHKERLREKVSSRGWMDDIFDENKKVIFLDHDKVPALETASGEKIENLTEAQLIIQIVEAMLLCGVEEKRIGIMSFYRAQMKHFKRAFLEYGAIDVLTADQFQGRDKDCVIISLVRSNDNNVAGDLLKEWRRINVSMTRAQSKLIVVGSGKMMRSIEKFGEFMKLVEQQRWLYELERGADKLYSTLASNVSPVKRQVVRPSVEPGSRVVLRSLVMKDIAAENS